MANWLTDEVLDHMIARAKEIAAKDPVYPPDMTTELKRLRAENEQLLEIRDALVAFDTKLSEAAEEGIKDNPVYKATELQAWTMLHKAVRLAAGEFDET